MIVDHICHTGHIFRLVFGFNFDVEFAGFGYDQMGIIVGFLQTFQQSDAICDAAGTGDSDNDSFGLGHGYFLLFELVQTANFGSPCIKLHRSN